MRISHNQWSLVIVSVIAFWPLVYAESGFFDSDGVNIRYVDDGQGSPVLLIHGITSSLDSWTETGKFDELVGEDYRAIALDLRGHGQSDWPTSPDKYGMEMVEDGRRLLDHLGISRAHIVGYSMGGKIAAKFAELYPERTSSLTIGGSGYPFWAPEPQTEEQTAERIRRWGGTAN